MPKRVMQGRALRDAKDKTVSVPVERSSPSALPEIMKRSTKYLAHDEKNVSKEGDIVRIREARPISKRKRFVVVADSGREG